MEHDIRLLDVARLLTGLKSNRETLVHSQKRKDVIKTSDMAATLNLCWCSFTRDPIMPNNGFEQ